MARTAEGFTLIELLVVITIIVTLLALLTPALDKAIYQAELAVCGADLKGGVEGFITYTAGNRRAYPHRNDAGGNNVSGNSPRIFGAGMDYRPMTRSYFSSNSVFNDPLSRAVDYEDPTATGSHGYAARCVWPGYKYASGQPMRRLGDRWTWSTASVTTVPLAYYRFNVIIGDIDFVTQPTPSQTWGSHPDGGGVLVQGSYQNTFPPEHELVGVAGISGGVNKFVMSRWWKLGGPNRGPQDLNYGLDDGSVERFTDVAWNDTVLGSETGRLRGVPWNSDETWAGQTLVSVPMAP